MLLLSADLQIHQNDLHSTACLAESTDTNQAWLGRVTERYLAAEQWTRWEARTYPDSSGQVALGNTVTGDCLHREVSAKQTEV